LKSLVIISLLLTSLTLPLFGQNRTDIAVHDKTLVQRGIIDGPSSRMIAVGTPGGFNYSFDALHCAPVYTWSGGFLDFKGELAGRGGGRCKILGVKQPLGTDTIPLRVGDPGQLPASIRFHGYRRNPKTGDPTFLFEVDGTPVEQHVHSPGPDKVSIKLSFPETGEAPRYYLLDPGSHVNIRLGEGLRWSGPGVIEIPAHLPEAAITIRLKSTNQTFVREEEHLTGAEIFQNYCSACHSTDGTKLIGPSFKDSWGNEQTVTRNGKTETLTVDETYVRESITKPQAAIVKGYELVPMADFSAMLTKEQIESLIEYLRDLE
jgi:mono/diheme cytochrome c family protein